MVLEFAPPRRAERVSLELEHDVYEALQQRVQEYNNEHGAGALTLAAAASHIINEAVRKAEKPVVRRRRKSAEAAVSYNDAEYR